MTLQELGSVKFTKAMSGYKPDEVESFLDLIRQDYGDFLTKLAVLQKENESLKAELEQFQDTKDSIQKVLFSAQRVSDELIANSQKEAQEQLAKARIEVEALEKKKQELLAGMEAEGARKTEEIENRIKARVTQAKLEAESVEKATADCVTRQQMLFDRLKLEIAEFKSNVLNSYKDHLEKLDTLPDTVPMDPKYVTEVITADFKNQPESVPTVKPAQEPRPQSEPSSKLPSESPEPEGNRFPQEPQMGFIVGDKKDFEEEEPV